VKSVPEIAGHIRTVVRELTGSEPGETLLDTLDSLGYATVLLDCEEWMGVQVTDDSVDWIGVGTVDGLADFLAAQQ
jgi:hypothetical protein